MTSGTDRLIEGLVGELRPVRPVPPLRAGFAILLAVWAALLGLVLWSQPHPPGAHHLGMDRVYLASFVGLVVAAFGASIAALAAGHPGRERLEQLGLVVALGGLGLAAAVCVVGIAGLGLDAPSPPGADRMCFGKGALLSLLPGGVVLGFLVRGWATRPLRASAIALFAAGALGAAIVHLSCDFLAPGHLLWGHMSVPAALVAVGLYPLGLLIARRRDAPRD